MTHPDAIFLYEFGGFRLDPKRRLLTGADGQPISLKPKVFDTLTYFVEQAGELLEKRTLMARIWGSVIVEENNLNQHISALRRVLGEGPGDNRFIVTVPGRGYRFVAPVHRVDGSASASTPAAVPLVPQQAPAVTVALGSNEPSRAGPGAFVIALCALAALVIAGWYGYEAMRPRGALASIKSVAVLPFENLSPDPANADFAPGIHDEIINQLMKLSGLEVLPRTTVMAFAGTTKSMPEIGRELNVDAVMESSVRYADDEVRITVRLVDAAAGKPIWGDTYEFKFERIFEIESDIAMNVAAGLEATLAPHEVAMLEEVPTRSARAYRLYLSAKDYERRGVTNSFTAIEQYERALEEDPSFANALADLSILRTVIIRFLEPHPEYVALARQEAEKALQLKPGLVKAKIAIANSQLLDGTSDPEQILQELNAIERAARRSYEFFVTRGDVYEVLGRFEAVVSDRATAAALEPQHVPLLVAAAESYIRLRKYAEAEQLLERAADIAPDDLGMLNHRGFMALARDGETAGLRALAQKSPMSTPVLTATIHDRDYEAALRLVEGFPDLNAVGPDDDWRFDRFFALGHIHQWAGRPEIARPLFESALAEIDRRLATVPIMRHARLEIARGEALAALGAADDAKASVRAGLDRLEEVPVGAQSGVQLDAAIVYASLGATGQAVDELDKYLSRPDRWSIEGLQGMPYFDLIRNEPAFQALVAKYERRQPEEQSAQARQPQ